MTDAIAIAGGYAHTIALRSDGKVWTWGWNDYGQLRDNSTDEKLVPKEVAELNAVVSIAGGYGHTLALKSDGSVWAWGYNNHGQLGDGTTNDRYTPIQINGLINIIAIAAGHYHSIALESDGEVWTWGANGSGQLGDETTNERHTPVRAKGPYNGVMAIAGAGYHTIALKSDGTVWAWGANGHGQVGNNSIDTAISVPVKIDFGLYGNPIESKTTAIAAGILHEVTNLHFLFSRQDAKIAKNIKTLRPLRLCERFKKAQSIPSLSIHIIP